MDDGCSKLCCIQVSKLRVHRCESFADEGHFGEFVEREQFQLDRVVRIVGVVGCAVCRIHHLCLQQWEMAGGGFIHSGDLAFQHFVAEVQSRESRVPFFQVFDDCECVLVVRKLPVGLKAFVQSVFTCMPKGGMPNVVQECKGFHKVLV